MCSRSGNLIAILFLILCNSLKAQNPRANDVTAPLHALAPSYPVPYTIPKTEEIKAVLIRVYNYLDSVTPFQFTNRLTNEAVKGLSNIDTNTIVKPGDFRLTSYEWGVVYSGMLRAGEITNDDRFTNYAKNRMNFIANSIDAFRALYQKYPTRSNPFRQPIDPRALDDAGAMCAAMIKTFRAGSQQNLRPIIDNYINYISTKEFRLS
ncbi:MAG TPA: glycoside hydrolase family 88 protein, partial [Chitinophagaceae bacterium]|nr:glycoside hydrolase family 88 protein [Chitinophagaceae bacterium]